MSYGDEWTKLYGGFNHYGTLRPTKSSPEQVFVEPLTLQEVCDYLRIAPPAEDQKEDNEIIGLISAARYQAEVMQNKDLVLKQWDLSYDYWPSYRIELRTPTASVDLVQYTDSNGNVTTMNNPTDYIVDLAKEPGIITLPYNGTWPTFTPWPSSALLFRFTSGYSNTSAFWRGSGSLIKTGMKLLISGWFNNRIPYELGSSSAAEYPFNVTSCLSYGAEVRAR